MASSRRLAGFLHALGFRATRGRLGVRSQRPEYSLQKRHLAVRLATVIRTVHSHIDTAADFQCLCNTFVTLDYTAVACCVSLSRTFAAILFWAFGYGFAFGDGTGAFIGSGAGWFMSTDNFFEESGAGMVRSGTLAMIAEIGIFVAFDISLRGRTLAVQLPAVRILVFPVGIRGHRLHHSLWSGG